MERTEEDDLDLSSWEKRNMFSYNLALPVMRHQHYPMEVIEKGSEKSEEKRYLMSFTVIESAFIDLETYFSETPCYQSSLLCNQGFDIYLKKGLHPSLHSVKERGIIYTLLNLSEEQRSKGVIAISTGSFAYILCYYGNMFDIPVTVVMPKLITNEHVKKCRDTGSQATVFVQGNDILDAHDFALRLAKQEGLFYLDGNDHPNMIIGQATLGLEIINGIVDIDAVILPTVIDNCGLTIGIAIAIKEINPEIIIIEVQPLNRDPLIKLIRTRTMLDDELEIPAIKYRWYQYSLTQTVPYRKVMLFNDCITVNDNSISAATKILQKTEDVTDYYAAIGLAPIVNGQLDILKGKRVVIPLFGAMDSTIDLAKNTSNPSVPRAGPSTSQN